MSDTLSTRTAIHPLEPLIADEVQKAVAIVRTQRTLGPSVFFVSVTLQEPPPEVTLAYHEGDALIRAAFMVLLDKTDGSGKTYEAVVDITNEQVTSWRYVAGVQPSIMLDEFFACQEAVKKDPCFIAALAKRGITNLDLVNVDPW
jgi:primary-amine oxidase